MKDFQTGEFKVVDIVPSKDGWGVAVCEAYNGRRFKVSVPGNMQQKKEVYNNRYLFIGKMLTVEYMYLTNDGLPFHPVAIAWRDYE